VGRAEALFFHSPPSLFLLFWCCLLVVKSGIWVIPNIEVSRQIALNPWVTQNPSSYLQYNWLQPLLAWLLGATTPVRFVLLNLTFAIAFIGLVLSQAWRHLTDRQARKSSLIFLCAPVGMTSLYWLGYDALTLLLMTLAVLAILSHARFTALVALALGWLLGMQHFEQGFVGFLLLLSYFLLVDPRVGPDRSLRSRPLLKTILLLLGAFLGKGSLSLIFAVHAISTPASRWDWLAPNLLILLKTFFLNAQAIVYSFFGVAWLPVLASVHARRRGFYWLLVLVVLLALAAITYDQTRSVAIGSFPLLAAALLLDPKALEQVSDRLILLVAGLFLLVPIVWVWGGIQQTSSFPTLLLYLSRLIRSGSLSYSMPVMAPFVPPLL
jgi:hypothetical protein